VDLSAQRRQQLFGGFVSDLGIRMAPNGA